VLDDLPMSECLMTIMSHVPLTLPVTYLLLLL
jgi:hypothetical protein